jgi:nucleoid-associated protein YgaU
VQKKPDGTPTTSPVPGKTAKKTSPEPKGAAEIAATPREHVPAQAGPRAETAPPRQPLGERHRVEAGEGGRRAAGVGEVASLPEAKAAEKRPTSKPPRLRGRRQRPPTARSDGAPIAAAQAPAVREAPPVGDTSRHAAQARDRAATPREKTAATSAPQSTTRRAARHRHGKASHLCKAAGTAIALPGWYVVRKGDTLWAIAHHHYGAGRRYRAIAAANRQRLHRPDRIFPCQRLYLPPPRPRR